MRTAALKQLPLRFEVETFLKFAQEGRYKDALTYLQPLTEAEAQNPDFFEAVSECYWQLDMKERSLSVLQLVLQLAPDRTQTILCLAGRLAQIGRQQEAGAIYRAIIQDDPDNIDAHIAITFVENLEADDPITKRLEAFLEDPAISRKKRYTLLTALGHIKKRDNPEDAFSLFAASNALQEAPYSPKEVEQLVDAQIKAFKSPVVLTSMPQGPVPEFTFIVGLPRSGTTLLNSMLACHPDIVSTDESPALLGARKMAQALSELIEPGSDLWSWTDTVSPSILEQARSRFFSGLPLPAGKMPGMVVNKLPHDRFELGFARMILPQSRSIFMMRHPLDVGLSLFTTNLKEGYEYTRRLEWIGHMIRQTYRSLDDFQSKLGDSLRVQSYRALVTDTEHQMRAILSHLGMPWDPACLSPENSDLALVTAYAHKVRAGVGTSGLDKWRKFESQLAPLIEALGGWDWIKAWEERDASLN